jgi:hypothetical protein
MPTWFRVALLAMTTLLLAPFVLLKTGAVQDAVAYTVSKLGKRVDPLLVADAALPGSLALPADGSYSINGMPVEYHTYAVKESADDVSRKFKLGFERAGYKFGVFDVRGTPTLVAVHPDTKMMLTVRLVRDRAGKPGMRLTQQDLSKLDPNFDARIPGMPLYPGAKQRMLISSIKGTPSQSLSYRAPGSPAMVEQFYRDEMSAGGWRRLDAPTRLGGDSPVSLFFERDGLESSLLIVPQEASSGTFVMLTLTGDPADLS